MLDDLKQLVANTGVPIFSVRVWLGAIDGETALRYLGNQEEFGINWMRLGILAQGALGLKVAIALLNSDWLDRAYRHAFPSIPSSPPPVRSSFVIPSSGMCQSPSALSANEQGMRIHKQFIVFPEPKSRFLPRSFPTSSRFAGQQKYYMKVGRNSRNRDILAEYVDRLANYSVAVEVLAIKLRT